jgi:hypothetical protein
MRGAEASLSMYLAPSSDSAAAGVIEEEEDKEAKVSSIHCLTSIAVPSGSVGPVAVWSILLPFRSAEGHSVLEPGNQRLERYARVSR